MRPPAPMPHGRRLRVARAGAGRRVAARPGPEPVDESLLDQGNVDVLGDGGQLLPLHDGSRRVSACCGG
jgi:hypothetical protein